MRVADYSVGLDSHAEVVRLLNVKSSGVLVFGIFGISGVGSTTLAKAVYNTLVGQFEHRGFISNVREISGQQDGLISLQKKLIDNLSLDNRVVMANEVTTNIATNKNMVHERKVMVVLDDVDDASQLNALCGEKEWFCKRSRIIITTRDIDVLSEHYVNQLYEVKELDSSQALQLLCRHG